MSIRLQALLSGQPVTARFRGRRAAGTEPRDERVVFESIYGTGEEARATFRRSLWDLNTKFTVYRQHGRWRYEPTGEIFTIIED